MAERQSDEGEQQRAHAGACEAFDELSEQCVQLGSSVTRRAVSVFERSASSFDHFAFRSLDPSIGTVGVTLSKRHVAISESTTCSVMNDL